MSRINDKFEWAYAVSLGRYVVVDRHTGKWAKWTSEDEAKRAAAMVGANAYAHRAASGVYRVERFT